MPGLRSVIGVSAATGGLVSLVLALVWFPRASAPVSPVPTQSPTQSPALAASDRVHEASHDLSDTIEELSEALGRERNKRLALADELQQLKQQVSEINKLTGQTSAGEAKSTDSESPSGEDRGSEFAQLWFDEKALYEQGLSVSEVRRLRLRFDAVELEKLTARDRARRDGWSTSARHSQELRDIQDRFRQEVGDEDYDRILFASGRRNRVRVADLLLGSAGDGSGLQGGDYIFSYAGERIFDPSALYILTTQGVLGASVELVIFRDGQTLHVWTLRGPLGARYDHLREPPG
jgi:hypothetical protein